MRRTLVPVAAAALALTATAFAPAAEAATDPDVLASGLVSPLSLAVGEDGVYTSQNFASTLTRIAADGTTTDVYSDEAHREVGAVSTFGSAVVFATTSQTAQPDARVWGIVGAGDPQQIANTWRFERRHNPDGDVSYGIQRLSRSCVQSIPRKERQGVVAYRGIKESHPYATVVDPERQRIFVADAAANAILGSTEDGKVETVAVLPPVRVKVTNKLRKSFGLPRCTLGKTFKGEPVPTDVELGPDGKLYVTTLGGALGEQLAVGAVYRVNPATHKARKVESGLRGPVGLAVTPDGTRYVSQLFGGVISQRADGGDMEEFASVPAPGDVEYADGAVYATETGLMSDPQGPPAGQVDRWQVQVVN